jgi:hypothetical protein
MMAISRGLRIRLEDPSLALGMTWELGGYGGAEVAIRRTNCRLSQH